MTAYKFALEKPKPFIISRWLAGHVAPETVDCHNFTLSLTFRNQCTGNGNLQVMPNSRESDMAPTERESVSKTYTLNFPNGHVETFEFSVNLICKHADPLVFCQF
ncbi:hypothetical protein ZIOFF_045495 [Zingiber officinale]|uniref:Uncharacterized protein n=1 Tax=Zingiber officinale TaxID=94328 RepID=A0A8J5G3X4_ZINOF|nr:hypothetical protein ZIOFF_045495 [Zingiber officinale]